MKKRKYINKIEIKDLCLILEYIIFNDIGKKNKKLDRLDRQLYDKCRLYINNYATNNDIEFINKCIENNYIIFLLRKTMDLADIEYINEYAEYCGYDTKEFVHPNIKNKLKQEDIYDLYLYYLGLEKQQNNNKQKKLTKKIDD